jgi:excisionase family DNA binding protein
MSMTETLPMLTPQDVARILGVHPKTVHLWLRNGSLYGIKISYRAWRIPQSALDRFIEQKRNGMPQKGTESSRDTGTGSVPPDASIRPAGDDPGISKAQMKHYIRDIMGEQSPETNPE